MIKFCLPWNLRNFPRRSGKYLAGFGMAWGLVSLLFVASYSYALDPATPKNNCSTGQIPNTCPNFCAYFKRVARAYCYPLPEQLCDNMDRLYQRMLIRYGSVQGACNSQDATSPQNCVDDWACYREGGINSFGELCNQTGKKCA